MYYFFQKLDKKYFFILLFVSFTLSIPALSYFYYIFSNSNFATRVSDYSQINFYSNSLIVLSILLFYIIPFCFLQRHLFLKYIKNNIKLIFNIFLIFCVPFLLGQLINIDLINFSLQGGGVFMKLANLFEINEFLFLSITSFVSLIILDFFFKEKRFQNLVC